MAFISVFSKRAMSIFIIMLYRMLNKRKRLLIPVPKSNRLALFYSPGCNYPPVLLSDNHRMILLRLLLLINYLFNTSYRILTFDELKTRYSCKDD